MGEFEVVPLVDATGPFFTDRLQAFPQATRAQWDAARDLDPTAFAADDGWELDFRAFLIRGARRNVLVDVGVGPVESPASAWAPVPGVLPSELERAGVEPADVDTVVLTHLHSDHCGWAVLPGGTPMFPNARYVVQQRETTPLQAGDTALSYVVSPLRSTDQLDEIDGELVLTPGIKIIPTPGHTPGHQSVEVDTGDRPVIVTGDVLVHAIQLVAPEVAYAYEDDSDEARRTRITLLQEATRRRAMLATAHLRQAFVEAQVSSEARRR